MYGDRSDPRAFWKRERTTAPGAASSHQPMGGAPIRPTGAPPVGTRPLGTPATPSTTWSPVRAPTAPVASGPPPRVGGAVASLVVAVLTLLVPVLGILMGLWFYLLIANVPGIVLGIKALRRIPDTAEVERYIRYTWACNFVYTALSVVLLVPLLILSALSLLMGG